MAGRNVHVSVCVCVSEDGWAMCLGRNSGGVGICRVHVVVLVLVLVRRNDEIGKSQGNACLTALKYVVCVISCPVNESHGHGESWRGRWEVSARTVRLLLFAVMFRGSWYTGMAGGF